MANLKSHHADGSWELFAHDGDIGVRGFGGTRNIAFEETAYALTAAIADPARVRQVDRVDIVCNAPNNDLLLREWLNAVIGEMSARGMLFSRFAVHMRDRGLTGKAWGEPVDEERHEPSAGIRGATTAGLSVALDDEGCWVAQCVLDI